MRAATLGVAVVACALVLAPAAQAEDFLSALFGAFGGHRAHDPYIRMPFASEGNPMMPQNEIPGPRMMTYGGGQAFCVRTCDGRYFPVSGPDNQKIGRAHV